MSNISTMKKLNLDNFNPIVPTDISLKERPNLLSSAHIEQMPEVRFVEEILDPLDYVEEILNLQEHIQWLVGVGLNDELYGLEDCNIAIVKTANDSSFPVEREIGPEIVVQGKVSKRYLKMQLISQNPANQVGHYRNMAINIVQLVRGTMGEFAY